MESRYAVRSWRWESGGKSEAGRPSLSVEWGDGRRTFHPPRWIEEQRRLLAEGGVDFESGRVGSGIGEEGDGRVPWPQGLSEADVRAPSSGMSLPFEEVVMGGGGGGGAGAGAGAGEKEDRHRSCGMRAALKAVHRHGLLLVTGMPADDGGAAVAALGAALGGGSGKGDPMTSVLARYRSDRPPGGREPLPPPSHPPPVHLLPGGTDGPLRTLYGSVWSTHAGGMVGDGSVADSAYGTDGLPLHTDLAYHRDPPGLQIFAMLRPARAGDGASVLVDGLAAAERLRAERPRSFEVLCATPRRYRCLDPGPGWHLEGTGPVIDAVDRGEAPPDRRGPRGGWERWGAVRSVRHNDLDRLPDLPPPSVLAGGDGAVDAFYAGLREAHADWDRILGSDGHRLVLRLGRGDAVVVANQRCLHGREGFVASAKDPRIVSGCYVSQDELDSRFRREGFLVR